MTKFFFWKRLNFINTKYTKYLRRQYKGQGLRTNKHACDLKTNQPPGSKQNRLHKQTACNTKTNTCTIRDKNKGTAHTPTPLTPQTKPSHHFPRINRTIRKNYIVSRMPNLPNRCVPNQRESDPSLFSTRSRHKTVEQHRKGRRNDQNKTKSSQRNTAFHTWTAKSQKRNKCDPTSSLPIQWTQSVKPPSIRTPRWAKLTLVGIRFRNNFHEKTITFEGAGLFQMFLKTRSSCSKLYSF
jgi:hypothetical protein